MEPAGCPNDDTLQRYVAGQLAESDRVIFNAHVVGCESCQRLLVELGRSESAVPERIEEFQLLKSLGRGAMGEVYLARDTKLDRLVAIKFLGAQGDEGRERLLREARAAARVHHPNLVTVHRVGDHEGRPYLVSEYVDGQTLAELPRPLDPVVVLRIATDLARGLAAAHREALLHRDIKPHNAMLTRDGAAKLVDFGLAKAAGGVPGGVVPSGAAVDLTQTGAIVGTPRYLAPELWRGEAATPQTDVYAFGVMLFELLTGRPPYAGGSIETVRDEVLNTDAKPLRELAPQLRPELCELVDRCVVRDPARRFASAAELLAALDWLNARPADLETHLKLPAPRRSAVPFVALAALIALGAGGLVLGARRAETGPRSSVPAAAKAYDEALVLYRGGSMRPALRKWSEAVEADPSLAAADLWIAALDTTLPRAREAYARARVNQGALTADEQALFAALGPGQVADPDLTAWSATLARAVKDRPGDARLRMVQAHVLQLSGDADGGSDALAEALRADPGLVAPVAAAEAALARSRGENARALEAWNTCLAASPLAADCLRGRTLLNEDRSECAAMERDARAWATAWPKDAEALKWLANVLVARGSPWPGVEEVLKARELLLTDRQRKEQLWYDVYSLAVARGDFAAAQKAGRTFVDSVPPGAGMFVHAAPAYMLMLALREAGDEAAAGALAWDQLQRAAAWSPESANEATLVLMFLKPALRSGHLDEAALERERARLTAVSGLDAHVSARVWAAGWAEGSLNADEAKAALTAHADWVKWDRPGQTTAGGHDFAMGTALVRAGRAAEALPWLDGAARACNGLDWPFAPVQAQAMRGEALEALGRNAEARAAYETVVKRWGEAKPRSVTAERARERLAALRP